MSGKDRRSKRVQAVHGDQPSVRGICNDPDPYLASSLRISTIRHLLFLRGGGLIADGYFLASDTDLLINWLYNLSISNDYYSIGAAISIIIFLFTSAVSLAVYVLSPSYRQEDTYQ